MSEKTKTCGHCGNTFTGYGSVCPQCGTPVFQQEQEASRWHRLDERLAEDAICASAKGVWKFTKWFTPKVARVGFNVAKRGVKAAASTEVGKATIQLAGEAVDYLTTEEETPPPSTSNAPGLMLLTLILVGVAVVIFINLPPSATTPSNTPLKTGTVSESSASSALVDESKKTAVKRYPQLAVAGSRFNTEFVARYKQLQKTRPEYFKDPAWPLRLAQEVNSSPHE